MVIDFALFDESGMLAYDGVIILRNEMVSLNISDTVFVKFGSPGMFGSTIMIQLPLFTIIQK
jgi:hypothetical protein